MRLARFLKQDYVDLYFDPLADAPDPWGEGASTAGDLDDDGEDDEEELTGRKLWAVKERIIQALVEMLERSGKVNNPRKLFTDLRNREAKATTGLGRGVALPHVRTNQARGFAMAVAVAPEPGLPFGAIDDEPVRLFVSMIAPPYDDKFYLKVERALARAMQEGDDLRDQILEAYDPGEVVRLLAVWVD